jgi:hypothetical protein
MGHRTETSCLVDLVDENLFGFVPKKSKLLHNFFNALLVPYHKLNKI